MKLPWNSPLPKSHRPLATALESASNLSMAVDSCVVKHPDQPSIPAVGIRTNQAWEAGRSLIMPAFAARALAADILAKAEDAERAAGQ